MKSNTLLLLMCLFPYWVMAQSSLFFSGFENDFTTDWSSTYATSLPTFERSTLSKYTGNYGCHVAFSASSQKANFTTPKTINWESGVTYKMVFWYKAIVPSDNSLTNLKFFDNAGTKIGQVAVTDWNSTEWTKYTVEFTPDVDADNGYVLFSFRPNNAGNSEFYLDVFAVKKEEEDTSVDFAKLKTEKVLSDTSIQWVQFGPGMSGNNKAAHWHPTDPNVLFIGPNMGNSYRSADKGKTYQTIYNEDESGVNNGFRGPRELFSVDFSRQNPDFGFATDERNKGIFVSNDRGETWTNPNIFNFSGKYIACISVDPKDDNIWYAGGGRMRDLGRLLFSEAEPYGNLSHTESLGKIWKSTDKGKTWTLKNSGLHDKTEIETIFVDPSRANTVYASTSRGFYKSKDGGETWVKKANGLDHDVLRAFDAHYDSNSDVLTMFVINNVTWKADGNTVTNKGGGIFKSIDRGATWTKLEGNLPLDMRQFENNYAIKKSYYHAVAYYFGLTDAEAQVQFPELPSKITQRFNTIEVDPNDVNNIYLNNEYSNSSRNNFKPGQLWRSSDGGQNWHVTLRNGKNWKAGSSDYSYWVNRGNPMETNISLKYLKHWVDRDDYERKGCNFVRFNADGTVLHTQMAKVSLMSYDKGETWVDIDDEEVTPHSENWVGAGNSNVPGHGFYQHLNIPNKVFCAAGENSLWVTNDEGDTVREGAQSAKFHSILDHEQSLSCYAIHPNNTDIHYALFFRQAGRGKLLRSTDAGQNWEEYGTAIPEWDLEAHSGDQSVHQLNLMIDPKNPRYMYFCVPKSSRNLEYVGNSVTAFGVHKSDDGGKTWSEVNVGLPESRDVPAICFDPANPKILYAAVQNADGGLFKSVNRGQSWEEVASTTAISGNKGINDVHFARDGKAYITAGTKAGNVNHGGVWVSEDNLQTWTKIFDYPWTFRVETAHYDPTTILVSTLPNSQIGMINPGVYLSKDSGQSWVKINKGNGQSDRINDIAIDNYTAGKYYVSTYGSGWYVAQDPNPNELTAVTGIESSMRIAAIEEGETYDLEVSILPPEVTFANYTWASSDNNIATVNAEGVVTGLKAGVVTIYASVVNTDLVAETEVTVIGKESPLSTLVEGVKDWKVYPNPAKSHLNIVGVALENVRFVVYNLSGKQVLDGNAKEMLDGRGNRLSIPVSQLNKGIYILELISSNAISQVKFVKD